MPLYDVHCSNKSCRHSQEYLSKNVDIDDVPCPRCIEGRLVKDAVQAFAVITRSKSSNGLYVVPTRKLADIHCPLPGCGKVIGDLWEAEVHRPGDN